MTIFSGRRRGVWERLQERKVVDDLPRRGEGAADAAGGLGGGEVGVVFEEGPEVGAPGGADVDAASVGGVERGEGFGGEDVGGAVAEGAGGDAEGGGEAARWQRTGGGASSG